jgi:glycosyltransferase involved in cell wall biosynthesis
MSAGLIVITSRLGGITEIIKNKNNGFLVDKATPENFAKAIKSVHSLSNSRKEITSAAARLTILQHHQQKIICSRLKEIFSLYEKK